VDNEGEPFELHLFREVPILAWLFLFSC
jgi:hypothetical protein